MLHQILLMTHITGAVVGISSGFLSMLFRKGASLHRVAGNIFVGSMLAMSGTAAYLAKVYKPNRMNLLAGLLTFYVVATGWWAAKRRERGVAPFDVAALAWISIVAVIAFTYAVTSTPSAAVLGAMAVLFALSDIRMLARGGVAAVNRMRRHIWRMSFALLIATLSFFPGQAKLFPRALLKVPAMYIPHIALVLSIIYWMVRTGKALPMRRDADLPAVLKDRTRRALGQASRADVFSERHEQPVDLDPVFSRQLPLQSPHRRVG
jgi:hypothetical protein